MTNTTGFFPKLAILSVLLAIVGCQTSQGSKTYTRGQAQTALTVYYGTVLSVAEVQIEAE